MKRLLFLCLSLLSLGCIAPSMWLTGIPQSRQALRVEPPLSDVVASEAASGDATADCPVTLPNGRSPDVPNMFFSLGNDDDTLYTIPWEDGIVIFEPGGPGSIEPDGSLAMKFPWYRAVPGQLAIEGRRLDAEAPPLRSRIPEGYGEIGFQATALIFPTEGCWEVTGRVGEASLTFVTLVVRLDD